MSVQPVRLPLGMVNAYLIPGVRGDILVDAGMPFSGNRLLRLLERQSPQTVARLALILLTHVHFDHVGALHVIRGRTDAPVLVHRSEAAILATGASPLPLGQTPMARTFMAVAGALTGRTRLKGSAAEVQVDDQMDLAEFGVAGRVLHTPGHTGGSLSVLLESGDAIVGDLCQYGFGYGMGNGPVWPPLADLPESVPSSMKRVLAAGAARIYPGHGRPFPAELLRHTLKKRLGEVGS